MWSRLSKALPNLQLGVSSSSHTQAPSPSNPKPASSSWEKGASPLALKTQPTPPPKSKMSPQLPPPPKPTQPFCCASHQIPNYCPESNLLTHFLHALATRRQQLSTSTSSPSSSPTPQPLFPPVSPLLKRSDITSPQIRIIEYETIVSSPTNLNRTYHHRYFLSLPSPSVLYQNHPEHEDSFVELTIKQFEAIRERLEGEWAFLSKDEVPKGRVGWKCRDCRWGY